jgi:hypothetical protein
MSRRALRLISAAARAFALAAAAAVATAACHPQSPATSVVPSAFIRETLITEDDIAHMSVHTAMDVVRMRAPRFSSGADSTPGRPGRVRIQEPHSVNADETPLLVVDGMQAGDLSYLDQIAATDVHAIHILGSDAAEPIYGLRAAGGAIVVETKRGK